MKENVKQVSAVPTVTVCLTQPAGIANSTQSG